MDINGRKTSSLVKMAPQFINSSPSTYHRSLRRVSFHLPTIPGPLSARDLAHATFPCYTSLDNENNYQCPTHCDLCLEDLDGTSTLRRLPCAHVFHQPCIDRWLCTRDASCPLCRREFYHFRKPQIAVFDRVRPRDLDYGGEDFYERERRLQQERHEDLREARAIFVKWWKKKFLDVFGVVRRGSSSSSSPSSSPSSSSSLSSSSSSSFQGD